MKLLLVTDNTVESVYKSISDNTQNENIGVDLFFDDDYIIPAHSSAKLKFGVRAEVVGDDGTNRGYFLIPRSSISKTNLIQANSVGLIDPGYRGYLMVVLRNLGDTDHYVKKHERLCQIVPLNNGKPFASVEIVNELSESARGSGAFGSTGL
jgi:dUTP pyrophosphatase